MRNVMWFRSKFTGLLLRNKRVARVMQHPRFVLTLLFFARLRRILVPRETSQQPEAPLLALTYPTGMTGDHDE